MKKNNMKAIFCRAINKPWKRILFMLLCILILNTLINITTGFNIIGNYLQKLLDSAEIYTREIRQNYINSTNNDPGSWTLRREAEWTSAKTIKLNYTFYSDFKVNDKAQDIIFILDLSSDSNVDEEFMSEMKYSISNIAFGILNDANNQVALIGFDQDAGILSSFTNNYDSFSNRVDALKFGKYNCNYSEALKMLDRLLNGYKYEESRNLTAIFISGRLPSKGTSNQISEYEFLKSKYSYLTINAVQYNMGSKARKDIESISDKQFIAEQQSDLYNKINEATNTFENYELLNIEDEYDTRYFKSIDETNITASNGIATIKSDGENLGIDWHFDSGSLTTGRQEKLEVTLKLKEEYYDLEAQHTKEGYYPLNTHITINSKLPNQEKESITNTEKLVMNPEYNVYFNSNAPEGCNMSSDYSEQHFVFETVRKPVVDALCSGYRFKGWKTDEWNPVTDINDDYFVMPDGGGYLFGEWSKLSIDKSLDGNVKEKNTLWKKIKSDANAKINYTKSLPKTSDEDFQVYYYSNAKYNNVLFAGFCWKIARTTETGGTKLIYNGEPQDNTCDYEDLNNTIANSKYNSDTNLNINSIGYMYNDTEEQVYYHNWSFLQYLGYSGDVSSFANYYYSKDFTFDEDTRTYSLVNPTQKLWLTDYDTLKGYYTCFSEENNPCVYVRYILNTYQSGDDGSGSIDYLNIMNGDTLDDVNIDIVLGSNYVQNEDQTYTLENVKRVKLLDWYENYGNYTSSNAHYVCSDISSTTCENIVHLIANNYGLRIGGAHINRNYRYSNAVTYDGEKYHLVDSESIWDYGYQFYSSPTLGNKHYTCFSTSDECEEVSYIFKIYADNVLYFKFTNGRLIEDVLKDSYGENSRNINKDSANYINKNESLIKQVVDEWYSNNLTTYTKYLEDTIWCNNRKITTYNGINNTYKWGTPYFNEGYYGNPDLSCPRKVDAFTVSEENGNGDLTYPIGLPTIQEYYLASNSLNVKESFWTMSPSGIDYRAEQYYIYQDPYNRWNSSGTISTDNESAIRPSISLHHNVEYISGTGSATEPYVIKMDE